MTAPAKRTAHYVVSTHWDREWYQSFQGYRYRLVSLLDEVLDLMAADERFAYWQSDGQSILIEDYLEIRPERREEIVAYARAGRLRIGPWYVLPDEFLVSGESLIRNLDLGIRVAAQFGKPSRVGFACDMFGHISQLPQILRGFSIDNALVWRGTNERTHGAMWRWQAPDGSEVLTYRFSPRGGYCSYAFFVRKGQKVDEPFRIDEAMDGLKELVAFETQRCPTPSLLLFDGGDHLEAEPQTAALLARANETFDDVQFVHSHLDGFIEDLREQREHITKVVRGELREPAEVGDDQWLIPGVLASRIHLKQANARCESELLLWAEPFAAFAVPLGRPWPHRYLEVAWRHLIANHPHDSMCACSIDQVHKDMEYRFDQAYGIAQLVAGDALQTIAARVKRPELGDKDFAVVVFNPTGDAIDGPVDLTLRFPADIDAKFQEWFGYEPKISFRLFDADGNEVPYQYVRQRKSVWGFRRRRYKFPAGEERHEVDVTCPIRIGPFGCTTLVCRPLKEPTRHLGTLAVDDHTIENEHLRVGVLPNGTLRLTDKRTGHTYDNLLTLEDRADIGDGWYHGTAVNDETYSSAAAGADVAIIADGPAKATIRTVVTMHVPQHFRFDRMVRSEPTAPLRVATTITLRRGSDAVEVQTIVENTIRDHRVRVLFPSGCSAETFFADGAFDVIERPIALRTDNAQLREMEVETKPQYTWTAVVDPAARRGLAVVSTGLPEAAVRDLPDRPIALTLLRSFIRAVMTSGQEGGEIQGRHEFRYLIVPLDGELPRARLCRLGQHLAAPPRSEQVYARDPVPEGAALPASTSFLRAGGEQAVITAVFRPADGNGLCVRMFNPTEGVITESIELRGGVTAAERVDFEGHSRDRVSVENGVACVELGPKQIITVRLT